VRGIGVAVMWSTCGARGTAGALRFGCGSLAHPEAVCCSSDDGDGEAVEDDVSSIRACVPTDSGRRAASEVAEDVGAAAFPAWSP